MLFKGHWSGMPDTRSAVRVLDPEDSYPRQRYLLNNVQLSSVQFTIEIYFIAAGMTSFELERLQH